MSVKEEEIMLERHEKILTEQVIPDIEGLKKITLNHEEKMKALEEYQRKSENQHISLTNDVQGVQLSQQDLKNTVERVGHDQKTMSEKQDRQFDKLFDHLLGRDNLKTQNEGALAVAKTQQEGAIKISQLSTKAQIIVGLCGATGLGGIVMSVLTLFYQK